MKQSKRGDEVDAYFDKAHPKIILEPGSAKNPARRLASWLQDELTAVTEKKVKCLEDNNVQGYQFHTGYMKALHEVGKRL